MADDEARWAARLAQRLDDVSAALAAAQARCKPRQDDPAAAEADDTGDSDAELEVQELTATQQALQVLLDGGGVGAMLPLTICLPIDGRRGGAAAAGRVAAGVVDAV